MTDIRAALAQERGDRGHRYDTDGYCIEQGCRYHIPADAPAAPTAEALRDALLDDWYRVGLDMATLDTRLDAIIAAARASR